MRSAPGSTVKDVHRDRFSAPTLKSAGRSGEGMINVEVRQRRRVKGSWDGEAEVTDDVVDRR